MYETVELLFVEDGCPEESGKAAAELWRSGPLPKNLRVRVLRLASRKGQQTAVFCGLEAASGEWVITMDDDTQHPPEFIPLLLKFRDEAVDLVYALPQGPRSAGSLGRDRLFRRFIKLPEGISLGSFRLIRGSLLEDLRGRGRGFVYVSAMLFNSGRPLRIRNVYYPAGRAPEPAAEPAVDSAVDSAVGEGDAVSKGASRIPLPARLALTAKLIVKYGLLRGRSMPWAGSAYRIEEEL